MWEEEQGSIRPVVWALFLFSLLLSSSLQRIVTLPFSTFSSSQPPPPTTVFHFIVPTSGLLFVFLRCALQRRCPVTIRNEFIYLEWFYLRIIVFD
uniref:Uncharacterized protein n=1 Tax=Anopheles darlingi TaxID=43151 RepID=A0A2M4DI04_ANODA